jgi:hypothetical protein
MLASGLRIGKERYRNLCCAATFYHQASEWLEKEATVGTAKQSVGQEVLIVPGGTPVELLLHEFTTAFAAAVQSIEELELLTLGRQLVGVPLDELEMKFRVELLEDGHE